MLDRRPRTKALRIGWVVGAVAVAVTIFGALKVAAPAVLTPS